LLIKDTEMIKVLFRSFIIVSLMLASFGFRAQNIYTLAGFGTWGFWGDNGPATKAQVHNPSGIAVDAAGNIYIADSQNHRIRRVSASGTITTIAGTGAPGFSGDSGLAINAKLYYPTDVELDAAGNLYIADKYNNRIRKITSGTITTVAGTTQGFSGDGGPATSAKLNYPVALAFDAAGNLYISDLYNIRIRKVTPSGIISTYAGKGSQGYTGDGGPATAAEFGFPSYIAMDASGNLYLSDPANYVIRKITAAGTMTTYAGSNAFGYSGDNGPATTAKLIWSSGITPDGLGNIYFADNYIHVVRKVNANDTIKNAAGSYPAGFSGDGLSAGSAKFRSPGDIEFDAAGNYYIADVGNQRIRKVTFSGTVTTVSTVAGGGTGGHNGDGIPSYTAELNLPHGTAVDAAGNLYIADQNNNRIRKIDPNGIITTVAGKDTAGYSGDGGLATAAKLNNPNDVAVDAAGNIYISDEYNHRIRMVSSGTITTLAGTGIGGFLGDGGPAASARLFNPHGVAVDISGNVYISDWYNNRIRKVTSGTITTIAGTTTPGYSGDDGPALGAKFNGPRGITVDAAGNIYFADFFNNRIRKISTTGTITTVAGNGQGTYTGDGGLAINSPIYNPSSVEVDAAGNLYIADHLNHRIRKVSTAGVISSVAGNGTPGFAGDMGLATAANLRSPYDVSVDAAGNLYISDMDNSRIRQVCAASCAIGIEEHSKKDNQLLVYPNPNNGSFTIVSPGNDEVIISNELGQVVRRIKLNDSNGFTSNLSDLQSGIYFAKGNNSWQKIVVVK